jgi:hypothetical protein
MTNSGDGPETGRENGALVETDCVAGVGGFELRNAYTNQVRTMYLRCRDNSR